MVRIFPRVEIEPYLQPLTRNCLKIDLNVRGSFLWDEKVHGRSEGFWLMVTDVNNEELLYYEYIVLKMRDVLEGKEYQYSFTVPLFENLHPLYYLRVVSDRWIQSETVMPLVFKNLILPEKFLQPTSLYDLQLLPRSTVNDKRLERVLELAGVGSHFNQIQTQAFQSLFVSQENIFLGAPTGSGKTACYFLAILKQLKRQQQAQYKKSKIVVLNPIASQCQALYDLLREPFQTLFQKRVGVLSGVQKQDLQILEKFDLVISLPEHFDVISRRWSVRPAFAQIGLIVADELHLLTENGSVYEVVVSRMRYASSQFDEPIQFVALATSLADYREVAAWVGANSKNTYNFPPSSRPNSLDLIFKGFEQTQRKVRLLQMQKHAYNALSQFLIEPGRQSIVFVSDRKQARLTALDLMTLASAENKPQKFANRKHLALLE